jgi:N-acetylmuramoyl-L-alanine amidase
MSDRLKRLIIILVLLGVAIVAYVPDSFQEPRLDTQSSEKTTPQPTAPPSPALSALAEMPDWSQLEAFQNTITRTEFEQLLTGVFTTSEAWRELIEISDSGADIRTAADETTPTFQLRFAKPGLAIPPPRSWKTAAELPPAPPNQPLSELHIAIDPGHIGGEWAKIEERWFVVGDGTPVCEGDLTLQVAKLLKPRLEALGAVVSLVREKPEPVTPVRPDALVSLAQETEAPPDSPAALQKLAERLFYRTAEIRARAKVVNDFLKPDLVLCLHFNAEAWGDPNQPTLVEHSHFHILVNGAYGDAEIALTDQRFALLKKLLSGIHREETAVGATVASTFASIGGLPPYRYPLDSTSVRPVSGQPYLWARNLLANRLYDCPVIYMEPYVMNSTIDYPRIQAGDYEGFREVNGKLQPSIFHEYADAMADGLSRHYANIRKLTESELPPAH